MSEHPVAESINPKKNEKETRKKSVLREILEWVLTFAVAFVLALIIRTFLFEPVRVDGESMLETLQNNEYMISTKYDYLAGNPARFHVVTCHYPGRTQTFVKRVVGLPGETLELRGGELYIDGTLIPQNFKRTPSTANFGPFTVPDGCYFVMGDNRDHSNDSRNPQVGALPRNLIRGHVQYVAFPFTNIRAITDGD
ncbi:MAG: signal peptidase I [Oscillospiraceae bacterium]|jgi:signal peptidase I|nr:signal peptidase I [Oscillospiraceae bacterium]